MATRALMRAERAEQLFSLYYLGMKFGRSTLSSYSSMFNWQQRIMGAD